MRFFERLSRLAAAIALTCIAAVPADGQSTLSRPPENGAPVRRLTVDEAVRLALEENLGLQIERVNPRIRDVATAQTRGSWAPHLTSSLLGNSTTIPAVNVFSGGDIKVNDKRLAADVGVRQLLPTGGSYAASWNSARARSTNIFSFYDPLLTSDLKLEVTQPLLRNFSIDPVRQQLALDERERYASDLQLRTAIARTTRDVKTAYWDLVAEIDNRQAVEQSLDLAKRQLADNERRVQLGTLAPVDIIEAQAEVARNEESVIVAEAAIRDAEDRLRAMIFTPASPDVWSVLEPAEPAPFEPRAIDVEAAIRRAVDERSDLQTARNNLQMSDISIRYLRNQLLPDISAQARYAVTGAGGAQLTPLTSLPIGDAIARSVIARRSYGSVIGDVFSNSYPAWSVGMTVSYPLGTSTEEADLARAKLQHGQRQTELEQIELRAAIEVRTIARRVLTNQKRVDSTRTARQLAERRLEAAQKKLAAGVETAFVVFQAQRDLTQARTGEVRAIADYNRSLVDFEAVQQIPLGLGETDRLARDLGLLTP
jgi:outer membrane protein